MGRSRSQSSSTLRVVTGTASPSVSATESRVRIRSEDSTTASDLESSETVPSANVGRGIEAISTGMTFDRLNVTAPTLSRALTSVKELFLIASIIHTYSADRCCSTTS